MTSIELLNVTHITNKVESGIIIIGFRNKDLSKYFIIQQDIAELNLNAESYYIELNGQGCSGYGLIERVEFGNNKIEFVLNEAGKIDMKIDRLILQLEKGVPKLDSLKMTLSKIFSKNRKFRIVKN